MPICIFDTNFCCLEPPIKITSLDFKQLLQIDHHQIQYHLTLIILWYISFFSSSSPSQINCKHIKHIKFSKMYCNMHIKRQTKCTFHIDKIEPAPRVSKLFRKFDANEWKEWRREKKTDSLFLCSTVIPFFVRTKPSKVSQKRWS